MRHVASFLIAGFAFILLAGCGRTGSDAGQGPLVLAASSMQQALVEASAEWTKRGHAPPVLSFAASSSLARQVESGAPADIFISADEQWMDHVAQAGMLREGSRKILAGNSLVLVVPRDSSFRWDGKPAALVQHLGNARLAMADPASVPAGRYGKAALEALGAWPAVQGRVAAAENVRAALALVERGQTPAGIVYGSDAQAAKLPVAFTFPEESHPAITYPMAILTASAHPDAAALHAFLLSEDGQSVLARHGLRRAH